MKVQWVSRPLWEKVVGGVVRVQWVSRPLWEKVVGGVVRVQWLSRPMWEESGWRCSESAVGV